MESNTGNLQSHSDSFTQLASYQMIDAQKYTNHPCLNTTSIPGTLCKTQPDVEGRVLGSWEGERNRGTFTPRRGGLSAYLKHAAMVAQLWRNAES